MELAHLPADATAEAIHAVLERDGALIIDDLADIDTIDRVAAEMAPFVEATPAGSDEFSGRNTKRTGALIARSPSSHELICHPLILDVAGRLLHRAKNIQLHLTQVISIGPGSEAQTVHRDQWAFDFFPFPPEIEVECHVMWAMTDFTERNGATRVIPGSNHWEDRLRPTADQTVPAEMTKGSVLMYVGSLYHGGGANRSDEHRLGVNVGYTLSWLRQEENQYLACPPSVARELPRELARLAGYRRGAYALGYYGDLQDPIDALTGADGTDGSAGFAP